MKANADQGYRSSSYIEGDEIALDPEHNLAVLRLLKVHPLEADFYSRIKWRQISEISVGLGILVTSRTVQPLPHIRLHNPFGKNGTNEYGRNRSYKDFALYVNSVLGSGRFQYEASTLLGSENQHALLPPDINEIVNDSIVESLGSIPTRSLFTAYDLSGLDKRQLQL
jgi:hypothetical protein